MGQRTEDRGRSRRSGEQEIRVQGIRNQDIRTIMTGGGCFKRLKEGRGLRTEDRSQETEVRPVFAKATTGRRQRDWGIIFIVLVGVMALAGCTYRLIIDN